jgi:hypothetical protein
MFKDNFSDCTSNGCNTIFKQASLPVFQNKIYNTQAEAFQAQTGMIELVQSGQSGFVFNKQFDPGIMVYDANYQNEQANSGVFQQHLKDVLTLLKSFGIADKKIVEVGCGKGVFFEMMMQEGLNCYGFDPTYEGNNPRITREYFSDKFNDINADVIIMRHTLEHITKPFSFLHTIAKTNNYKGFLFVEVPTIEWILNKRAFWDIFYEHCNYFSEASLSIMFDEAVTGNFFNGQYIYLWADLSKLRNTIPKANINININMESTNMTDRILEFEDFLKKHPSLAIWGAGAKGSTFLNLLDKNRKYVKYVIDINPAKQERHIACTGHKIYSPEILRKDPVDNILVMNENYLEEIRESVKELNVNIFNL